MVTSLLFFSALQFLLILFLWRRCRIQANTIDSFGMGERALCDAQKLADFGYYVYDVKTMSWTSSVALDSIFGIDQSYKRDVDGWLNLVHPDFRELIQAYFQDDVLSKHQKFDKKYKIVNIKTGQERWVHGLGNLKFDKQGNPVEMFGVIQDITEHKLAEERHVSQLRFLKNIERINAITRQTVDIEKMMSDVLKMTLEIFEADRAWLFYPCDPESDSWRVPMECTRPEYPCSHEFGCEIAMDEKIRTVLRETLDNKGVITVDYRDSSAAQNVDENLPMLSEMHMAIYPRVGKPWVFGVHQCSYYRNWSDEEKELFYEIGCRITDVLSVLLFLKDLRDSEEKWRSLTENSRDYIVLLDKNYSIQFINHDVPGFTMGQVIGESILNFVPSNFRQAAQNCYERVLSTHKPGRYEAEYFIDDGKHPLFFDVQVTPLIGDDGEVTGFISTSSDVTERKKSELALRRSHKMEAIGQLTGGISHDFNNVLGIILGNIELMNETELGLTEEGIEQFKSIQKAAQRAAGLVKKLSDFSRSQAAQLVIVDINELLENLGELVSRALTPEIEIEQHLTKELWLVEIDPGDFEDALLNLLINARDAMPDGGELTIETSNCILDEAYCARKHDVVPGEYACLTVSDSGEGISLEQQEHIFEPFFTTKLPGKGTGLGLAMVFGFAKRSGGHIDFYSELGLGTVFRIYLPKVNDETKQELTSDPQVEALPRGNETILVVDDEEALLGLACSALQALGYRVLTAINGVEALEYLANEKSIDLLISDVVMPGGMNGFELAEKATTICPALKVLLSSGYSEKVVVKSGQACFSANLLSKPYSLADLARGVWAILNNDDDNNKSDQLAVTPIKWSKMLSVGIDVIDEDHKVLLALLNRARYTCRGGEIAECNIVLKSLKKYVETHFIREEALMAICKYPGLENHRQVHQLLIKQVQNMQRDLNDGKLSAYELAAFLSSWLIEHIQGMDRAFAPYCQCSADTIARVVSQAAPAPDSQEGA